MIERIPKEWLRFFRCTRCHTVYAIEAIDELKERESLFGGLWCIHYHGMPRPPLQEIVNL